MMTAEKQKPLTVSQAARIVGVSSVTFRKWVNLGEVEHVRVGNVVRILPQGMERFIKSHTKGAKSDA